MPHQTHVSAEYQVLTQGAAEAEAGRYDSDMAEAASVRSSPDRSAPASSGENLEKQGQSVADSRVLVSPSLVLGLGVSPRWLSSGDSEQEGPSFSGEGVESCGNYGLGL